MRKSNRNRKSIFTLTTILAVLMATGLSFTLDQTIVHAEDEEYTEEYIEEYGEEYIEEYVEEYTEADYVDIETCDTAGMTTLSTDAAAAHFNVPYVATYYFNPKPSIYDEIIIPLYMTDYEQTEYMPTVMTIGEDAQYVYGTPGTLDLLYEVDGHSYEIDNIPLGDYTLNLGKLSKGNHVFSVQVRDNSTGLTSHRLYNDLWVVDPAETEITDADTYIMSTDDLIKYGINNVGSTDASDMNNTRDGLNKLFIDVQAAGKKKIVLLKGTYRINGEDAGREKSIKIPSHLTVDMNGSTFKLNPILTDKDYFSATGTKPAAIGCLVLFDNVIDAHLINGTLEGDRFERMAENLETADASKSGLVEQINTVIMRGGKYCSLNNLTIKDTTGHTVTKFYVWGKELFLKGYTRTAIFDGVEVNAANCSTSSYTDLTDIINANAAERDTFMGENYMYVGHPQGYRGIRGDSAIVYVSFYTENKSFIETVTSFEYRKILIPDNAKYARVTLLGTDFTEYDYSVPGSLDGSVSIYSKHYGDYFEFTDIDFVDTRTCALAPATCDNLLIKDCTFTRCGNSITPAAVDFEDGAQECQDIYYMNNTVLEAAGTVSLIDNYGFNHLLINNTNHSYEVRQRVIGGLITGINDNTSTIVWRLGDKARAGYGRIMNNNCGMINVTDDMGDKKTFYPNPVNFVVKNCYINRGCLESNPQYVTYDNCTFYLINGGQAALRNCTVQFDYNPGSFVGSDLYCYDCVFMALDGRSTHNINWNQAVCATRLFVNCQFLGHTTPNFFLASATFIDCNFDDISITGWASSRDTTYSEKVLFRGCTFNSTGGYFFNVGPLSDYVGYINYTFDNCTITHYGNKLVQLTATPTSDGTNVSHVTFNHCSINKEVNAKEINDALGFEFVQVTDPVNTLDTEIKGYSVTVSDKITLNFHIGMNSSLYNNASAMVHFILPSGETCDVKVSDGVKDIKNTDTYIYTCEVPASRMTTYIYASVIIPSSDGSGIPQKAGDTYKCTVREYAYKILQNPAAYTSEQLSTVKAMLNYGAYAQQYFNININNLANRDIYSATNNPVNNAIPGISAYEAANVKSNSTLTFVGSSLVCEGVTSLLLYFRADPSIPSATLAGRLSVKATLNGSVRNCSGKIVNGLYVVTLKNITASELDASFAFTITDASVSANKLTFNYSPMNYIALAQKSDNDNLVNLTRSMYYFNQAAKALSK